MNTGFKVVQPGAQTLIQDTGRYGHHQQGFTQGGPMDLSSFSMANALCGNAIEATALEITIGGLVLDAQVTTFFAVTGAQNKVTINGRPVPLWHTLKIIKGSSIGLGFASKGCRNYLSVAGGFNIASQFGSTATVVREGIGGLNGGPLRSGDWLPAPECDDLAGYCVPLAQQPRLQQEVVLRVLNTYQQQLYSKKDLNNFFNQPYRVSQRIDRVGYCLEGEAIANPVPGIISEGTCLGAIQITTKGQPIILLRDRPTIGGYAKIGTLLSADLDLLTQLMPGALVQFQRITLEEAQQLARQAAETSFQLEPL